MVLKQPILLDSTKLEPISLSRIIDNADIQNSLLENETISSRKLMAVGFKVSRLSKLNLIAVELPNLSMSDCLITDTDFSGFSVGEAYFERCVVKNSRLSGTQLYESTFVDVVFDGCKLDMANFRSSKLKRVEFHDCVMVDTDFSGAKLIDVCMLDCDLEKANFNSSNIEKLNLSGSHIAGILGTGSLKNTTVTADQVISLAPAMARDIGMISEE